MASLSWPWDREPLLPREEGGQVEGGPVLSGAPDDVATVGSQALPLSSRGIEPLEPRAEDEDGRCSDLNRELQYDSYAEQDLTPVEREWYERYKHDPERDL